MANTIRLKRGTTEPEANNLVTGELAVNTGDGAIYTKLDDGTVTPIVGKSNNLFVAVRNETGATIPAFSAVYINGASNGKPTIALAQANTEASSSKTLGYTTASISTGHNGEVVVSGLLTKVNTSQYSAGASLWLSATTAGASTSTVPVSPNHAVFLGTVVDVATNGKVEVKVQNGYELGELHDILLTSPSNDQLLTYESSSGLWKNKSLTPQVTTLSSFPFSTSIGYQHTFRVDSASNVYVELATNAQLAHPIGTRATFVQMNTGKMDFSPLYGVTVLSYGNKLRSTGQYAVVNAVKTGSGEWTIYGELEASYPAAGTILSSSCISTNGYDSANNYWTGTWTAQIEYADGDGGSYTDTANNTLGCWYPSGWVLESTSSDATLSWTHGFDSGDFVYGSTTTSIVADGAGTSTSGSSTTVTASDGQTVHTYEGYDGANNWATNEILYFDLATTSLVAVSYTASGVVTASGCTSIDSTDASGVLWNALNAYYTETADGYGGSATNYQLNTETCGYLPSGYWTSYSAGDASFYYYDEYGTEVQFIYGTYTSGQQADGYGGSIDFNDSSNTYESGYVFYSYYDYNYPGTLNYAFDGSNSYYTFYS